MTHALGDAGGLGKAGGRAGTRRPGQGSRARHVSTRDRVLRMPGSEPKSGNPFKTSFILDEPSLAILVDRERSAEVQLGRGGKRSDLIRELLRRYDEMCRAELPALSRDERTTLLEAGRAIRGPGDALRSLFEGLRRHAEGDKILQRMKGLSATQQVAILDFVERELARQSKTVGIEPAARPTAKSTRR
jgi:hypothetical protein